MASSPPGGGWLTVVGSSYPRATCVFLEFADAAQVRFASDFMNGASFCGSHIIAVPAISLNRLFIGNISRSASAAAIRDAIARVEPVRVVLRGCVRAQMLDDPRRKRGVLEKLHRCCNPLDWETAFAK